MSDKNIGHFVWRLITFLFQCFYIVDSDVYLSSTHRTNCWVSIATVVAWTHHNVTL